MDILKNFYNQLKDLFLGMTPGNRITVGLLFTGLLLSILFLFIGFMTPESTNVPIYGGRTFDQSQQIAIADALSRANLSEYDWKEGKLYVPKKETARYIGAISEAKAVIGLGGHLQQAVNGIAAYETGKMIDNKMRRAKEVEIASVLRSWSWIHDASVISDVRQKRNPNLYENISINSVTVTVTPYKQVMLDEQQCSAITAAVMPAFGITDLKDITIIDGNTGASFYGSDEKIKGGTKTHEDTQEYYQKQWEKRLQELFPDINGFIVKVSVELDKSLWRNEHEVKHAKPTAVSTRERNTELDKTDRDIAGRPGMVPQNGLPLPNSQAQVIQGGKTRETTEENERNMALQGVESNSRYAGLLPKSITASIRVPISYIKKVWIERNSKSGEEITEPTETDLATIRTEILADIREAASKLMEPLRPLDMPDTTQMVAVRTYDDSRPIIEAKATSMQIFLAWLGANWETMALLALVLVGMTVLWSMTRVRQPEPIVIYEAAELPMEDMPMTDEEIAALEAEEGYKRSLEPFNKSSRSLEVEVADLVTENPDAAASVLKQWIGNIAFQE